MPVRGFHEQSLTTILIQEHFACLIFIQKYFNGKIYLYIPYSGKFSNGANFCIFRMSAVHMKIRKLIRKFEHSKNKMTRDL